MTYRPVTRVSFFSNEVIELGFEYVRGNVAVSYKETFFVAVADLSGDMD